MFYKLFTLAVQATIARAPQASVSFPGPQKIPPFQGFTMILSLSWSIALGVPLVANRELQLRFRRGSLVANGATTIIGSDHA
jgi:hypothetical protein